MGQAVSVEIPEMGKPSLLHRMSMRRSVKSQVSSQNQNTSELETPKRVKPLTVLGDPRSPASMEVTVRTPIVLPKDAAQRGPFDYLSKDFETYQELAEMKKEIEREMEGLQTRMRKQVYSLRQNVLKTTGLDFLKSDLGLEEKVNNEPPPENLFNELSLNEIAKEAKKVSQLIDLATSVPEPSGVLEVSEPENCDSSSLSSVEMKFFSTEAVVEKENTPLKRHLPIMMKSSSGGDSMAKPQNKLLSNKPHGDVGFSKVFVSPAAQRVALARRSLVHTPKSRKTVKVFNDASKNSSVRKDTPRPQGQVPASGPLLVKKPTPLPRVAMKQLQTKP